jgi:hypothetical protein
MSDAEGAGKPDSELTQQELKERTELIARVDASYLLDDKRAAIRFEHTSSFLRKKVIAENNGHFKSLNNIH